MENNKVVDMCFYREAKISYQKLKEKKNDNIGLDFDNYLKLRKFIVMLSKKKEEAPSV